MPSILTEKKEKKWEKKRKKRKGKRKKIKKEDTNFRHISLRTNPCEVNENYENIQIELGTLLLCGIVMKTGN